MKTNGMDRPTKRAGMRRSGSYWPQKPPSKHLRDGLPVAVKEKRRRRNKASRLQRKANRR